MNTAVQKATLLSRIEGLNHIPTVPAVLAPLLRYMEQPLEQIGCSKSYRHDRSGQIPRSPVPADGE